jgi:hypothetical protein
MVEYSMAILGRTHALQKSSAWPFRLLAQLM